MPAYTTATATPDPSRVCNLHHSSQQRQILNPLSEARDQTHILTDAMFCVNLLSQWELLKILKKLLLGIVYLYKLSITGYKVYKICKI